MSPAQPEGVPLPGAGELPEAVRASSAAPGAAPRPFCVYLHVPYCRVRCGYCDFNTYTAQFGAGADLDTYAGSVLAEAALALSLIHI